MKLTNKQNLPETLVRAIQNHKHIGGGDISSSQLLKSPRAFWLEKRHFDELEQDVSNQIWALFGTAVHGIAEMGECEDSLVEEYGKIKVGDYTLTGTVDLLENGILRDYKTGSQWTIIFLDNDKKAEYISQLNAYAEIYREKGFEVKGLEIVLMLRDWQASKAKFDASYPQSQVAVIEIPLFTREQTQAYLKERINYLMSFKDVSDDDLPLCSPAFRWAKPSKWAVMKKGRKSAVKLFDNEESATKHMELLNQKINTHYLEERKADEWKRCEYCSARKFCNQTEYIEVPLRKVKPIKVNMTYERFMEVVNG